jgi:uncharacterized LabA/DUF88 family protein
MPNNDTTPNRTLMIFVDQQNYFHLCLDANKKTDLLRLRSFIVSRDGGRRLCEMVVYYGFPPHVPGQNIPEHWKTREYALDKQIEWAEYQGIMTARWYGKIMRDEHEDWTGEYDADVDVLMAVDALDFAMECKPDIVALVTHDGHFAHLARKLRRLGIRVEAFCKESNISGLLKRAVNQVHDLEGHLNVLPPAKAGVSIEEYYT